MRMGLRLGLGLVGLVWGFILTTGTWPIISVCLTSFAVDDDDDYDDTQRSWSTMMEWEA